MGFKHKIYTSVFIYIYHRPTHEMSNYFHRYFCVRWLASSIPIMSDWETTNQSHRERDNEMLKFIYKLIDRLGAREFIYLVLCLSVLPIQIEIRSYMSTFHRPIYRWNIILFASIDRSSIHLYISSDGETWL